MARSVLTDNMLGMGITFTIYISSKDNKRYIVCSHDADSVLFPERKDQVLRDAIALARSRQWRVEHFGGRKLFIVADEEVEKVRRHPEYEKYSSSYFILAVGELFQESRSITFLDKCLNTLENTYDYWKEFGKWIRLSRNSVLEGAILTEDSGFMYACDPPEAHLVMSHLQNHSLWMIHDIGNDEYSPLKDVKLRAESLIEVEKIKAGKESKLNKGFFIRRWNEDVDVFFDPIERAVSVETGCLIVPVWKDQKNTKVDELILRRIKEATVIVADVTGDRFNVGLEIGYAIALRKQVILLKDKADGFELPFDIRTLNCFFYEKDKPDVLTQVLVERVKDGLEEARLGTH